MPVRSSLPEQAEEKTEGGTGYSRFSQKITVKMD